MTKVPQDPNSIQIPAVIYAAKSTPDEKDSTGDQTEIVRQRISEIGGRKIVGAFAEENVSGYKGDRGAQLTQAIQDAVAAADDHGESELWVFHSSRLARGSGRKNEARALAAIFWDMRRRGVTLRSVMDDEFITNPSLTGIASEQAHKYSNDLSDHVKRGLRQTFDAGQRLGGPVPDGYVLKVVRDARDKIVSREYPVDPERQAVIRRLFELADGGTVPENIATRLNAEGHRTKRGKPWRRTRVIDALSNPFYAGMVARNRTKQDEDVDVREGTHEALIDPAVFARIQAQRGTHDLAAGSSRKPGRPYSRHALAGLVECGRCGSRMYSTVSPYKRKDGSQKRSYVCASVKDGTGMCDAPPVNAEKVDAAVVEHLGGFFVDFDGWLSRIAAAGTSEGEQAERNIEIERAAVDQAVTAVDKIKRRVAKALAEEDDQMARAAAAALEVKERDADQARRRLTQQERILAAAETAVPVDAALDYFNALRDAVRGRIDRSASMRELNAELRAMFKAFRLDTTVEGIRCLPVLDDDPSRFVIVNQDPCNDDPTMAPGRIYTLGGPVDPEPIRTLVPHDHRPFSQEPNSQL